MPLAPDVTAIIAVAAAAVAVLAVILTLALALPARRHARAAAREAAELRTAYDALGVTSGESLLAAVERQSRLIAELQHEVEWAQGAVAAMREEMGSSVRHVSVVRYDAFDELAGQLSFSAALVNDSGTGLVVSSINSRSDTRTYAKAVVNGQSEHRLSPEELEALTAANSDAGAGTGSVAPVR